MTKQSKKSKKLVIGENDLANTHPHLVKEWHPTLNRDLTPQTVTQGAAKVVYWQCEHQHPPYPAPINRRTRGAKCPYCSGRKPIVGENDLATTHPEVSKQWHPTLNGDLTPRDFKATSMKRAFWLCDLGHHWDAQILNRTAALSKCPYCSGKKVWRGFNDLATTHPEIAKQWHPTKNGDLTPEQVSHGSNRKAWFVCEKGHDIHVHICNKSNGISCGYCSGRLTLSGYNDLATTHPELAKEWHPTLNEDLTPQQVSHGMQKPVYWQCKNGHVFVSRIHNRSLGGRCPVCFKHRKTLQAGFNDLATTHPNLAKEWHPTENGKLTPQHVTSGSGKRVWWKCSCGCEWRGNISHRANGGNPCPHCRP